MTKPRILLTVTLSLRDWAKLLGYKDTVMYSRWSRWRDERAILAPRFSHGGARRGPTPRELGPREKPRGHQVLIEWQGRIQNLTEWAKELGIKPVTIHRRRILGWTVEQMLSTKTLRVGAKLKQRQRLSQEEWEKLQQRDREGQRRWYRDRPRY